MKGFKKENKGGSDLMEAKWIDRGNTALVSGEYEEAISIFTEVIAVDKNNSDAYRGRGAAHLFLGFYIEAIRDCTEAIAIKSAIRWIYLSGYIVFSNWRL